MFSLLIRRLLGALLSSALLLLACTASVAESCGAREPVSLHSAGYDGGYSVLPTGVDGRILAAAMRAQASVPAPGMALRPATRESEHPLHVATKAHGVRRANMYPPRRLLRRDRAGASKSAASTSPG